MDKHTPQTLSDWLNYLSHREIDFLSQLALGLGDNPSVINIGAGGGTSALTLLSARPDLNLTTIDIQDEVTPVGGLENERMILAASGIDYAERYTTYHGDSKIAGDSWIDDWANEIVDMVFVDGDHSYEGCKGDIENWLPNIRPGGVIALHDYYKVEHYVSEHPGEEITPEIVASVIKPYPGVDSAVDELLSKHYVTIGVADTLIAFRK